MRFFASPLCGHSRILFDLVDCFDQGLLALRIEKTDEADRLVKWRIPQFSGFHVAIVLDMLNHLADEGDLLLIQRLIVNER